MIRYTLTAIALVVFSFSVTAQIGVLPITAEAARKYQEGEFRAAKILIEESIKGEGASDAYSWQVRGHIFKEIYKTEEKSMLDAPHRDGAIESFKTCIGLDAEKKYLEWNRTSLRYLASTYWNDAVSIMEQHDRKQMPKSEQFFTKYIEIMQIARPDDSIDEFTLDFYRAYATANRKIIERLRKKGVVPEDYATELKRVEQSYLKALEVSPDDYGSNYNLSINLYNEAAYRIGKLPAEAKLTEVLILQLGCVEILMRALPNAVIAEEIRPGRIEILKALRAIHLSLNDYEKFDKYNQLVRQKQGELIIDEDTQYKLDRKFFQEEEIDH
jgi:hypothetical protein